MANTVHDGTVYMGWSTNNLVCAIDIVTGKEKWNHANSGHVYTKPLIVGNSVFYGCSDGRLYELNKESGEEIATYQVGAEIFSSPKVDNGIIYFGSDDGFLYALEDAQIAEFVVYIPDSIGNNIQGLIDYQMVPFLLEKGFKQVNDEELFNFINKRIEDKKPSAITFAHPIIPPDIVGESVQDGLFRQYLDAGGKVVWNGTVPNFFALGENGFPKRDFNTGAIMLEIEYASPSESGNYYSKPTRIGLNMGFPNWTKSTGSAVKLSPDIIPLTEDEFGNITGFIKKFNSRTGSGFISNRSWAWNVGMSKADLDLVYKLATYGLK